MPSRSRSTPLHLRRTSGDTDAVATIPLSEAQDRLAALVEAVENSHEIVTITRHGREAAVLMAKEDLDSLHETLFWLSQPGGRRDIEEAPGAAERGETVSGDELRAEFRLDV